MTTVRNTTTPDSADLRLTVTDAASEEQALDAAEAMLATSRYTKDATIYQCLPDGPTTWVIWAEH